MCLCVCVCVSQEGMEWMCCYTDVFVDVCLRREWNGCVVTQMCLFVCVSGGNGMDVMLHRCVC